MQQVITISPEGIMSGLQRKPGQGLNLQKFGHAQTTRASEIIWDEDAQMWAIDVLQEAGRGIVTARKLESAGVQMTSLGLACDFGWQAPDCRAVFDNYDDAVKVEIAYLDALRLKGIF